MVVFPWEESPLSGQKKDNRENHQFLVRLGLTAPLDLSQIHFEAGVNPLSCSYHGRGWLTLLVTGANKGEIEDKLTQFQRKNKLSDIALDL